MTVNNNILYIDYGQVDYTPAIIDYDFINKRPRGGSSRIDFFSHGMISSTLEDISIENKVFIKKDNIFFEKGVFLLDFSQIVKNHNLFIDMVKDLKFNKIYVENSKHYNILPVVEKLTNVEVILMNFGSEESGK